MKRQIAIDSCNLLKERNISYRSRERVFPTAKICRYKRFACENPQITFEKRLDGHLHPAAIITPVELSSMKYSWVAFMSGAVRKSVYYFIT